MAFFDKLKDAANAAKDKAKATVDAAKANHEQKKAEQAAHDEQMRQLAEEKAQKIVQEITSAAGDSGFFSQVSEEQLLSFTKEFYDKLLMPANSVSRSKITMHPYITGKKFNKFCEKVTCFDQSEKPVLFLNEEKKKEIVITANSLYFLLPLEEDNKYTVTGKIPCDQISSFCVEKTESACVVKCNGCNLMTMPADKTALEDSISLQKYFDCISQQDFTITDEEVDQLIREKIGPKVCAEVQKYMIYDDELLVYFAWGLDSLSAKDYFVCTNKQVIMVNREMGGATANIKQFYYEDITSASVLQNSECNTLGGYLLDTALTAAMQTCDLVLTVAGATTKINTLYKVEAERVVAVYHQYRKLAKAQASQPQVIVQQAAQIDPMEQLEKLSKLKAAGIISEDEFNQKKADLLAKL